MPIFTYDMDPGSELLSQMTDYNLQAFRLHLIIPSPSYSRGQIEIGYDLSLSFSENRKDAIFERRGPIHYKRLKPLPVPRLGRFPIFLLARGPIHTPDESLESDCGLLSIHCAMEDIVRPPAQQFSRQLRGTVAKDRNNRLARKERLCIAEDREKPASIVRADEQDGERALSLGQVPPGSLAVAEHVRATDETIDPFTPQEPRLVAGLDKPEPPIVTGQECGGIERIR